MVQPTSAVLRSKGSSREGATPARQQGQAAQRPRERTLGRPAREASLGGPSQRESSEAGCEHQDQVGGELEPKTVPVPPIADHVHE
jgi:hypothetical protein